MLIDGSRFKPLPRPLVLAPGFHGVVSADGFGPGELLANGGGQPIVWSTEEDGCLLSFVGGGRFGDPAAPGAFPANADGGPPNRYAAGTFAYEPVTGFLQLAGDCSQDGMRDVSDILCLVKLRFPGLFLLTRDRPETPCASESLTDPGNLAIIDFNDDGIFDVSDVVGFARFIVMGGSPPAQGTDCFEVAIELGCSANVACP